MIVAAVLKLILTMFTCGRVEWILLRNVESREHV